MKGQLFIVGVSRSGSKLVRDVLNSSISFRISRTELKIIPAIARLSSTLRNSQALHIKDVDKIYNIVIRSTFIKKLQWSGLEFSLTLPQFRKQFIGLRHQDIFEYLVTLGYQLESNEKLNGSVRYFGDKTPSNWRYAASIDMAYDSAIFIHVVRDGRSVALSFSKSWGKTLIGSALKWSRQIREIRRSLSSVEHITINYEKIIDDTQNELNKLGSYLNVSVQCFDLKSFRSTEQFGSAAGITGISKNSIYSYDHLPHYIVRIIESIQYEELVGLGYRVERHRYYKTVRTVFNFLYPLYKLLDFFMYCWHLVFKEYGLYRGVVFITRTIRLKFL